MSFIFAPPVSLLPRDILTTTTRNDNDNNMKLLNEFERFDMEDGGGVDIDVVADVIETDDSKTIELASPRGSTTRRRRRRKNTDSQNEDDANEELEVVVQPRHCPGHDSAEVEDESSATEDNPLEQYKDIATLESLRVPELRKICRDHSFKVSGKKRDLIRRLHEAANAPSAFVE